MKCHPSSIPVIGYAIRDVNMCFLDRNWEKDRHNLDVFIENFISAASPRFPSFNQEVLLMGCNNGCGFGGGSCLWIILIIILLCCCCGGAGESSSGGCGCGNSCC